MKKFKEFLRVNNISIREMAKILDISPSTVNDLLNSDRLPTLKLASVIEKLSFGNITLYDWLDVTQQSVSQKTKNDKKNKNTKK